MQIIFDVIGFLLVIVGMFWGMFYLMSWICTLHNPSFHWVLWAAVISGLVAAFKANA